MASPAARAAFVKPAIFALLALNAGIYAAAGRFSEGLDALAWFALLALFEIEARWPQWARRPRNAALLDLLRLAATAGVGIAMLAFVHEREWLDALNAALWLGVVIVLELEIRAPALVARHRRANRNISVALYGALATVALLWLVRGEWLDAYDAALWIAAFALIEMDLLQPPPSGKS